MNNYRVFLGSLCAFFHDSGYLTNKVIGGKLDGWKNNNYVHSYVYHIIV